jgi:inorganic triphosphatase YgiF
MSIDIEPDAIGPLGAVTAHAGRDLRAALAAAFRDAIDDARRAQSETSVDAAVHECRKALRRARATLRLVAPALPRDDRRDLRRALRDARRLLSASRDVAVLPGAIAALSVDDDTRTAIAASLGAPPPADETRALVQDAVARVTPLVEMLSVALPPILEWDDVAEGLADTYRAARRAADKRRSRAAFHAIRRRSKELSEQLEVLAGGTDGKTEALRKRFNELHEALTTGVDRIMLREHVGALAPEADRDRLLAAIDADLADPLRAGRKAARDAFDRRTRRFVKKVGRAVRRDHAPPPPPAN